MKVAELMKCPNCKSIPNLTQWTDTKKPNATWIECSCGIITKTFYHKDADVAKKRATKVWNSRAENRIIADKKLKLLSCGFCGSKEIYKSKYKFVNGNNKYEFGHWSECSCGIITDPIIYVNEKEVILTRKEASDLWNWCYIVRK